MGDGGGLDGGGLQLSWPDIEANLMEEAEAKTVLQLFLRWRSDSYVLTAWTLENFTLGLPAEVSRVSTSHSSFDHSYCWELASDRRALVGIMVTMTLFPNVFLFGCCLERDVWGKPSFIWSLPRMRGP